MFANLKTYGLRLLKTVQTITTFRNPLADPMGTRRGPPLVRGPQFENRCANRLIRLVEKSTRLDRLDRLVDDFSIDSTRLGRFSIDSIDSIDQLRGLVDISCHTFSS